MILNLRCVPCDATFEADLEKESYEAKKRHRRVAKRLRDRGIPITKREEYSIEAIAKRFARAFQEAHDGHQLEATLDGQEFPLG